MNVAAEDTTEPAVPLGLIQRSLSAKTTRTDHLESLLQSIDATVFLVLGTLYLNDNFTFLFILRTACQLLYASSQFPPIIAANLICVATHVLHERPEGAKATRGYLHGGLICDFVGELGPTSKSKLLLLDGLVLVLQLSYLAICHELQVIKGADLAEPKPQQQDIEAEEAGIRREVQDINSSHADQDGIELQPMLPGSTSTSHKPAHKVIPEEDLVMSLDLRKSLTGAIKRGAAVNAESGASAGRLGVLLERITRARSAAVRA